MHNVPSTKKAEMVHSAQWCTRHMTWGSQRVRQCTPLNYIASLWPLGHDLIKKEKLGHLDVAAAAISMMYSYQHGAWFTARHKIAVEHHPIILPVFLPPFFPSIDVLQVQVDCHRRADQVQLKRYRWSRTICGGAPFNLEELCESLPVQIEMYQFLI